MTIRVVYTILRKVYEMQDYEHMVLAIDELISHRVSGIICMESCRNCYFPKGFRKVFDSFCEIRRDYEENREKYLDEKKEMVERARFEARCRQEKERILTSFIDELKKLAPDIDFSEKVRNYYCALEQEDVQTPEMYLSVYPFLASLVSAKEERVREL